MRKASVGHGSDCPPELPPRAGSLDALLRADFEAHGAEAIKVVRRKHPAIYLRLIAEILPRDLSLSAIEIGKIGDEELARIIQDLRARADGAAADGKRTKPAQGQG